MKEGFLIFLKSLLSRSIVFYLLFILMVWQVLDYRQMVSNTVPETLSRLTPPIDYFSEFVDHNDHFDRFKLLDCVYYHKAVANFFITQKAEAMGMLGFCYERLGEAEMAKSAYKDSISLNPDYFWPYFDLGVIYFNENKFSQAENYFHQAIDQMPIKTIVLLSRSKVYNDVHLSQREGSYDYLDGLKQGRLQAYVLWMESLNKMGLFDQLLLGALNGIQEGLDLKGVFYFYAGLACYNQKSYQKSLQFLQIALQKDPQNTEAVFYMGMCLKESNRVDMANFLINKSQLMHDQGPSSLSRMLKPRVRFF